MADEIEENADVQVVQAGGIGCTVNQDEGTEVRVVIASEVKICVIQAGGVSIKVTI